MLSQKKSLKLCRLFVVINLILFSSSLTEILAQKPSFTFGSKDRIELLKSDLDYNTQSGCLILGDFQYINPLSSSKFDLTRKIKIKILDKEDIQPILPSKLFKDNPGKSIKCSIYKMNVYQNGNVVQKTSIKDSDLTDEFFKLNLNNQAIIEYEFREVRESINQLDWLGWEKIPVLESEFHFSRPHFIESIIEGIPDSIREINDLGERKFEFDSIKSIIDLPNKELKLKFEVDIWKLSNPPRKLILGKINLNVGSLQYEKHKSQLFERNRIPYIKKDLNAEFLKSNSEAKAFIYYDKAVNDLRDGQFTREMKIVILKSSGSSVGNFETPVSTGRGYGKEKINVIVFNREGENYTRHVMNDESIYKINIDGRENAYVYRFAAPKITEGSFIFVDYKLTDFTLFDWNFQHNVPAGYSEYEVIVPDNIEFSKKIIGNHFVEYEKLTQKTSNYTKHKFVGRDIPQFNNESFITSPKNHKSSVSLHLTKEGSLDFWPNWESATNLLFDLNSFGGMMKCHSSLKKEVINIKKLEKDPVKLLQKIYKYIIENYSWNERLGIISSDSQIKLMKVKSGGVGAINLTLISMLKEAGFNARPIVTKTRSSGLMDITAPKLLDLNYVLCGVRLDGKLIYLDATDKLRPMDVLPERALNYFGVMLSEENHEVVTLPGSQVSKEIIYINASYNETGKLSGSVQHSYDGYLGYELRNKIDTGSVESHKEKIADEFLFMDVEEHQLIVDDDIYKPIKETFNITSNNSESGKIVMDLFLSPYIRGNPFSTDKREYPLSLTKLPNYTYILNLRLPENMIISEIPQSEIMYMTEDKKYGMMKVLYKKVSDNQLQVTQKVIITKDMFLPYEYPFLKNFYKEIIKTCKKTITISKI